MLSLQEMSDRLEIQDLITRYAYAIDEQDWDALDRVFTADAVIDYTDLGGAKGSLSETKAYLAQAMPTFPAFQHLSTTTRIDIDGDSAKTRTILFNPMVMNHEGEERVFFIGLWYNDELVRTADGWRIRHRREQKCWSFNAPAGLLP
ncbi:MAG: nuclear transport factor 2 family protein [Rhizorhabdus sp.]|uniref:nuclear transport factor 2 family protein n=1 Tax=Rhizorhabdus sp. TaxID=1968843 RepID=UPI001B53BD58|nr:nuclear transport factor 2 family protein [Rhizorhabdus sp.]MBP8235891.1 nuclear transport factor 2 family protein [Rhizorhabdus sp.]